MFERVKFVFDVYKAYRLERKQGLDRNNAKASAVAQVVGRRIATLPSAAPSASQPRELPRSAVNTWINPAQGFGREAGEDAVFGGGSFEITPAHIALLRQMRICWEGAERGAPMLDPSAPYGRADLLAQLAEGFALDDADLLARRHVEMYFVLARALKHGALEPGTYTLMNIDPDNVRRMMQGYRGSAGVLDEALGLNGDGSVTITDEHVTLIRHIEVIWPSPSECDERIDLGDYPAAACDPKRPYGNHTFIEVDMARILGCLPSSHEGARDEDLAAFEPEPDLAERLQHLHWQMLVAIQVFVERARLAPGAYSM